MDKEISSQQQIALRIVEDATPTERDALKRWVKELLDIRGDEASPLTKAKKALSITASNKVLWPMIKVIARAMKRYGWDKQKAPIKFGIVGAGVGLALFGSAAAGIAALGGAIGVPLWIVLGSGVVCSHAL